VNSCFEQLAAGTELVKWVLRIIGWFMMFFGCYGLFQPVLTFIQVVPFLGPFVAKLGGAVIWFLCGLGTLLISTVIVSFAHLFYHPKKALLLLSLILGVTCLVMFAGSLMNSGDSSAQA